MPAADLVPALVELHQLLEGNDRSGADARYETLRPLLTFESQSLAHFIAGSKFVLHRAGVLPTAKVRTTEGELSSGERNELSSLLDALATDSLSRQRKPTTA